MTIINYTTGITELSRQLTNDKEVLAFLGNFWTRYYKDTAAITTVNTGAFWQVQTEYDRILNAVLSSNILNIPETQSKAYSIIIFDSSKMERVGADYIQHPCTEDIPFLTSTLMEPTIILENNVHYVIDGGYIKFYVDLFNDENLVNNVYTTNNNYMLLWAVDTVLQENFIYDRFGVYLYEQLNDSAAAKVLYVALQYFFTNQKTIKQIENVLNALAGMPYSFYDCGLVLDITATKIITEYKVFDIPTDGEILVQVGDNVPAFTLLYRIITVDDYITDPDWYLDKEFPFKFMDSLFVCFDGEYREFQYMDESALLDGDLVWDGYKKDWLVNPEVLYAPMTFDGSITFKGLYPPDEITFKQPTTMVQGSALYNFMDRYLKYNVIALHSLRDGVDIDTLYSAISKGMPAHLNYVII